MVTGDASTNTAAALVSGAKEWAKQYGDFSNGTEGAVLTAVLRCRAAWDAGDPDAMADMFIDNGSMLAGDDQLTDREAIRTHLAGALEGDLRGTALVASAQAIRMLTDDVAVVVTEGGIAAPGASAAEVAAPVRATWVAVKRDDDWRIASYQTSPLRD